MRAVQALTPEQWERVGRYRPDHPMVGGPVSVEAWVAQTVAHDGYHLRQISEVLLAGTGN